MRMNFEHKKSSDTLIVIPVFNEEKSIGGVIDEIMQTCADMDLLIINDGSHDSTETVLNQKKSNFFYIKHLFNMGIGTSFQTACQFAVRKGYNYLIRIDGDGQHDCRYIHPAIEPLVKKSCDIVIGSRFLEDSNFTTSSLRLIGIQIISIVLNLLTKKKITDPTSGFCAMNRKAFTFFSTTCTEDYPEPEIVFYHKQFRITEMPISISRRKQGVSSITPIRSLYYMIKVLLSLVMHFFRKEPS